MAPVIPNPRTLEMIVNNSPVGPFDIGTLDENGRRKYVIITEKDYPENRVAFNNVVQGNLERHGYLSSFNADDDDLENGVGKPAIFVLRMNDDELEQIKADPKTQKITESFIMKPQKFEAGIDVGLPG